MRRAQHAREIRKKSRSLGFAEESSFDSLRSLRTPTLVGSSAALGMTIVVESMVSQR